MGTSPLDRAFAGSMAARAITGGSEPTTSACVLRFLRAHLVHLLILPVMAIVVTTTHEAAHALAALAQGGEVTEFVVLPANGLWGWMRYDPPRSGPFSHFSVSVAPYVMWTGLAGVTVVLGAARARFPLWLGSTLFVWGFVVPLGDVANAALPYLACARNDLRAAFGPPTLLAGLVVAAAILLGVALGYPLERRLYGEHALSARGYALLTGMFFCALGVVFGVF